MAKRAKNLVIVESPAKAKTIEKFLGRSHYQVVASMGHVRDLPKSQLGVDLENDFTPKYITIRGKGPIIADLKKAAKKANKIYLASDPDREGEAIAWHLSKQLGLDEDDKCRITFNEITKDAVKNAVQEPRTIDMDLVDAQQARRVVDRIVGYKLSPLLWRKVKKGFSAGRVQSVALRLICEREEEIKNFEPVEYWSLTSTFTNSRQDTFTAKLAKIDNKKAEIPNKETMQAILDDLEDASYQVGKVKKTMRKKNPPRPFTTSALQQEASRRLNYTARKTMRIAQGLYEGVALEGSGPVGLITYMRTDSVRISAAAQAEAQDLITADYGKKYLGGPPKRTKAAGGNVQDAHEAIRPTSAMRRPQDVKPYLSNEQYKLYSLIWTRFIASQMAAADIQQTSAAVLAKQYTFSATGSVIIFDGYMKVEQEFNKDKKEEGFLPELNDDEGVQLKRHDPKQHFTQPPARYNEASLIKTMEELGIGRPSTYVAIIETITGRNYVVRENKQFYPTEAGELVNDLLVTHFGDTINVDFTAELESELDDVESGDRYWKDVIRSFWQAFEPHLEKAEENIGDVKIEDEVTDILCEKCGKPFVIKMGRFGKFLACSGFPDCRNTRPLLEKIGVTCPKCHEGDVVKRRSKKGRVFYGCSRYPDCDFVSWDKPTGETCPACKEGYLVEKNTKRSQRIVCSNKDCSYKVEKEADHE
ncbi:type I DNA topoisomerase [Peptococcus simiae]|uniref:type I DNA topoisomerase n=1 Tax=Peptococcus simiae TaxID=1643805 RepID=UPI0039800D62